jgi:hypothetical protein
VENLNSCDGACEMKVRRVLVVAFEKDLTSKFNPWYWNVMSHENLGRGPQDKQEISDEPLVFAGKSDSEEG